MDLDMDRIKRRILITILRTLNLGLMALSFGLAALSVFAGSADGMRFSDFLSLRISLPNFAIGALMLWSWNFAFSLLGLFESKRLARIHSLASDTAKATTIACIFFATIARVFVIQMATPKFIVAFWATSTILLVGTRVGMWYLLRAIRLHGRNLRHILIIGTNPRALAFVEQLNTKLELGYRVLGFVDERWAGFTEFDHLRHIWCCDFNGLAAYLRQNVVDEAALYLPMKSLYNQASQVVALCEQHGISVRFDPELFDLKIARFETIEIGGVAHVAAQVSCPKGWPALAKRAIDMALSLILLVLLSPLFLVVAILVKVTSLGPVLFLQERVGLNKRKFRIIKFRTMVVNAEKMLPQLERLNEISGPVFKIKRDPRITSVGTFLRRTSIDELPQLFNVLRGEMSLVGPRPLPVRDYEGFHEDWQRRRFSIRPGMTCLWQVAGRSNVSFDQWMRLDLKYMDEWSLWLDVKILARTVPAVLRGSGAA
jgi:exopolysaccharide biosynthesis polyprenyl glycosylphosphotransferase